MSPAALAVLLIALAYVLGSIPFGVLIGRLKGVDPRSGGSGNIGATNVLRLLGWGPGLLVLALDMLKGFVPVWLAAQAPAPAWGAWQPVLAGFAAIVGHATSVFLRFRGGKSVATGFGVVMALDWHAGLIFAGVFLLVLALTRYVSVASMLAACSLPVVMAGRRPLPTFLVGLFVALFVIYKHRANCARLRRGTENRFSLRPAGLGRRD